MNNLLLHNPFNGITQLNRNSNFLTQFGSHALAYSTLQPELSHFYTQDGYITYRDFCGETIVIGNPVATENGYTSLLDEFLRFRPKCSFIQVCDQVSDILVQNSFSVDYFGAESKIDLPFQTIGKQKKEIRNLINSAQRNNTQVRELFNREGLEKFISYKGNSILNRFITKKSPHEYAFLARPVKDSFEKDVRIFGGFQNNSLVCYSLFDPIYANDKIIGYAESISRQMPSSPKGSRTYTLIEAMHKFSLENISFVNIGLLPFYPDGNNKEIFHGQNNKMVRQIFSMLYKSSPMISNFAGLSFHKSRYRGELFPRYFATNTINPYKTLLCIYKLTTGNWIPII